MKQGIIYIVFGEAYDDLAAHTISYSRKFTNLPICVITNVIDRSKKWNKIKNISFQEYFLDNNINREIKTSLIKYSPFEETLYLDCDSVIQKFGIENVFKIMNDKDLLLNLFLKWEVGEKVLQIYKNTMKITEVTLPLSIYNGAFICWRKTEKMKYFFSEWNKFWNLMGKGRDMPSLACTVKKLKIQVAEINSKHSIFSPDTPDEDCIVQHNYNSYKDKDFHKIFKLPRIKENKPFDTDPKDWNMVNFND